MSVRPRIDLVSDDVYGEGMLNHKGVSMGIEDIFRELLTEAQSQLEGTNPFAFPVKFWVRSIGEHVPNVSLEGEVMAFGQHCRANEFLLAAAIENKGYFKRLAYMMKCMRTVANHLHHLVAEYTQDCRAKSLLRPIADDYWMGRPSMDDNGRYRPTYQYSQIDWGCGGNVASAGVSSSAVLRTYDSGVTWNCDALTACPIPDEFLGLEALINGKVK